MPSVYNYRHVELDKVGRGKRVIQPPGGQTADIFGRSTYDQAYSSASSQAGSDVASSRVHIETDQQSIASSNQMPVDGMMLKQQQQMQQQQQSVGNNGQMSPTGSVGSSSVASTGITHSSGVSSSGTGQQQLLMADDFKPMPQQDGSIQQLQQQMSRPMTAQDPSRTPKKTIPVLRRNPITGEIIEPVERPTVVRVRQPPGGRSSGIF